MRIVENAESAEPFLLFPFIFEQLDHEDLLARYFEMGDLHSVFVPAGSHGPDFNSLTMTLILKLQSINAGLAMEYRDG